MASQAFHRLMLAQQLEFCLKIMVKHDLFPVALNVAGLAFFAVLTLVLVDLEMTGHAFMRRALVAAWISMAFIAFHFQVLAIESEMGLFQAVIEFCFFPVTLVMAALAVST